MKNTSKASVPAPHAPTEDEIRDYAAHLFQQSGCAPGRDVDNWLEAKACLEANIPKQHSHTRLHRHRHPVETETMTIMAVATPLDPIADDLYADEDVVLEEIILRDVSPASPRRSGL